MLTRRSHIYLSLAFVVALSLALASGGCAPKKPPKVAEIPPPPSGPPNVYIEVNIPATEMTVFENGVPKFVKPVAIGQGVYPTPTQESQIKKIEWNPWWYPPPGAEWARDEKVTPPGPGNPLGLVKMPLSQEILFHGTNKRSSVGRAASHGCMRMYNEDAVEVAWYLQGLFSDKNDPALLETYKKNKKTTYVVQLETPVTVGIVYKPVVVKAGKLVFYPDYYKKIANRKKSAITAEITGAGVAPECVDESKIDELAKDWPARGTEIPIAMLLIHTAGEKTTEGPVCQ